MLELFQKVGNWHNFELSIMQVVFPNTKLILSVVNVIANAVHKDKEFQVAGC